MKNAVIYARVSSKEQEREGFSIPAQLKLLREYAVRQDFVIATEFVDIETAKSSGRQRFNEMVSFCSKPQNPKTILVEKTDRLYRNFRDAVTLEDLGIEIHLVKEGQIISRDARSQDKLIHGMQLVLARNYIENLREEVKKGMREKASQGVYPGRAPLGYRNNRLARTIEVHPENAFLVGNIFELYASSQFSLTELRKEVYLASGKKISRAYLHAILNNPFYVGMFVWGGQMYRGNHPIFIDLQIYHRAQEILRSRNKPKYRKHEFAFRGLLTCARDNCAITAERKKGKYVYYRCTGYRGKCATPRFTEPQIAAQLGTVLQDIHIPDSVLSALQEALGNDQRRITTEFHAQKRILEQRLSSLRQQMDQAYQDKLQGRISVDFWERQMQGWSQIEREILAQLSHTSRLPSVRVIDAQRTLELANKAYSLYVRRTPAEQAELLRLVLLNCAVDGTSVYPTYRKPFDLICRRVRNEQWSRVALLEQSRSRGFLADVLEKCPLLVW